MKHHTIDLQNKLPNITAKNVYVINAPRDWMPLEEAAVSVGKSVRTLRRLIARGAIKASLDGTKYTLFMPSLYEYLQDHIVKIPESAKKELSK